MNRVLFLVPGLLASGIALANSAVDLPDTVVTASRQAQSLSRTPAATTVFTRSEIERLQPSSVADLLRRVPGASVTTTGGQGSLTSLSLRGTGSTQSLVLVDGQRIGSASAGQPSLEFLNIDQIERIEVIRGPRSAIYGSDAIGGVVQIFTRQGESGLNPRVTAGIGSNNTYRRHVGMSGGNQQTRFDLGASLNETAGFDRTRHEEAGDQDDDGYRNRAFNASLSHNFTDDVEAGVRLLEQSGNTEYDLNGNPEDDFTLSTVATHLQWQVSQLWTTRLEAGHAEDKRSSHYDANAFGPAATYSYNTYRDSASWLNSLRLSEQHSLQTGVDWYQDRLRSTGSYLQTERYNRAAFVQHRFEGEAYQTELGWRHDDNEQFGNANTFNAALTVPITDNQQVVASYGEGFRAPTFNDLYTSFGANPNLRPERSKSYELQWRGQVQAAQLQAAAFRTDIDDLILLDPFFTAQNISRARIHGLELSASTQVAGWDTLLAATWLDPRDRNSGNQLPRRPKRLLSLDVDRQLGVFGIGFSLSANSQRYNDPANEQELSGYGLVEARARWNMTPALRWDLKVGNLLDKDYSLANYNYNGQTYGYREVDINAQLSVSWTPSY
ncbi:TonB-dependent receptor domain-containing protein [Halopseudomonas pelagia]|uniref:TonB-dependent receptor n=1 Tax=Halopseudomonas pelagia TaxID=553151 RepID=A0AA91Z5C8_9GAMM|nr:TonB-dependent receptor [Halopseudomonas pelagia]PCC98626.1 TonB-dependent receptor [Halopseudomonas pelagia]QFY55588.1 TonB-dependent receptor [Halopseudomonas pelagia]